MELPDTEVYALRLAEIAPILRSFRIASTSVQARA